MKIEKEEIKTSDGGEYASFPHSCVSLNIHESDNRCDLSTEQSPL